MLKFWKVGNLNDDYGFKFDILEMVDFKWYSRKCLQYKYFKF